MIQMGKHKIHRNRRIVGTNGEDATTNNRKNKIRSGSNNFAYNNGGQKEIDDYDDDDWIIE